MAEDMVAGSVPDTVSLPPFCECGLIRVRPPLLVHYSAIFAELCWQMEVLLSWNPMGRYLESKQSRVV